MAHLSNALSALCSYFSSSSSSSYETEDDPETNPSISLIDDYQSDHDLPSDESDVQDVSLPPTTPTTMDVPWFLGNTGEQIRSALPEETSRRTRFQTRRMNI